MLGEHRGEQALGKEHNGEGIDDGGAACWRPGGDLDDGDDDRRGGDEGEHHRGGGRRAQEVDAKHHKSNRGCCR